MVKRLPAIAAVSALTLVAGCGPIPNLDGHRSRPCLETQPANFKYSDRTTSYSTAVLAIELRGGGGTGRCDKDWCQAQGPVSATVKDKPNRERHFYIPDGWIGGVRTHPPADCRMVNIDDHGNMELSRFFDP
jgi:hypothetical protein